MKRKSIVVLLVTVMLVGFASADIVWENNMDADPDGDGWAVRSGRNAYDVTTTPGVLTMAGGAFSTLLDTVPEDPFLGTTTIDMEFRATSGQSTANGGIGLWFNAGVSGDATEYGYLRMSSGMNDNADGQIFLLQDSGGELTSHAFGTGMLTMNAVVNQILNTVTYTVTDGSAAFGDTLTYAASTAIGANTKGLATMYTAGPAGEIDYIKIDNVVPEPATMVLLGLGGLLLRKRK